MADDGHNRVQVAATGAAWQVPILGAMLFVHLLLLAWGGSRQAPTFNEPAHLVAGISHFEFGRFELYRENPPLVRMVAAMPLFAVGYQSDWSRFDNSPGARPAFEMGERFVQANGPRSMWLFTLARWMCIPFSVIGAWTCYRWARDLAGETAGLTAAALWCGSPEILAHGQLITPDVPATAMAVLACYTFWRWLRRATWTHTLLAGAALGIAELTKTTLILLYPLYLLIWLTVRWRHDGARSLRRIRSEIAMLTVGLLISIYIINAGYGYDSTLRRLAAFHFVSNLFTGGNHRDAAPKRADGGDVAGANRFAATWLGDLPVPLPASYVTGLDIQQADFEDFRRPSYLRGIFREHGWWYYYLYGLIVKAPLALWSLAILTAIRRLRYPCSGPGAHADIILLTVPSAILALASAKCGFSHHMRYILPCLPFAFCWIAANLFAPVPVAAGPRFVPTSIRFPPRLTFLMIIWFWADSMMVFPHSLSYFNTFAGGPFGGPKHLLGSNVDWGQDLLFLKDKLSRIEGDEPMFVSYYGGSDPEHHGIFHWRPMPTRAARGNASRHLIPGYYAISVNLLYGDPWPARRGAEPDGRLPQALLDELMALKRVDSAGYSIYLYHVAR